MKRYNPKDIEPKWQQQWESDKIYQATEDPAKPKEYVLDFFPYPSGAAMHVGHVRNYTISDVIARTARQQGKNVLHPMGWDAFGLPAENYAIKTGTPPAQTVANSTANFRQQATQMGIGYDWSREINSSDPSYYKWTQWFFTLLFERGLAYQKESLQWWCETDKTVLANEQVEAGRCWRCGNEVTKKPLKQWFFKITDYADRLVADLDTVDWSESIKTMQRKWIGRSEGAAIKFSLDGLGSKDEHLEVFTTAHDTIYGVTFMVIAPEHPIAKKYAQLAENSQDIEVYIEKAARKSELDRQIEKQKTGVPIDGLYAINPVNGAKIPVWVADYVLVTYGTGAIMAVPGEDERDFEFAKKYQLPIIYTTDRQEFVNYQTDIKNNRAAYKIANSEEFNGLDFVEGRAKILQKIEASGAGQSITQYKIRDWLISRQRYWGAPIPIIHCPDHGAVAVPNDQLPVELPPITDYQPTGDGRSPLGKVAEWVNTTCPECGKPAKRETDTMDGFACSSWYFLRFADPHNDQKPFDADKVKFWLPVDTYVGGAEHAVMHLLYARFWTKVMYDADLVDFEEPFTALRNHGMIQAPDGRKMSKSLGNVIAPDALIADGYGADSIRLMELFIAPWNQKANWSTEGLGGCYRFLQRFWALAQEVIDGAAQPTGQIDGDQEIRRVVHKTIKKVSQDIADLGFNTAIAAMMEAVNDLYKLRATLPIAQHADTWQWAMQNLAQLLAPFAPHMAEELWHQLGQTDTVHVDHWPTWDEACLKQDTVSIVVQVNGKVRAQVVMPVAADESAVTQAALANQHVKGFVTGDPKKVIYVPGKLINIVV